MDRMDLRIFGKEMRRKRRKGSVELLEKFGKPKELKTLKRAQDYKNRDKEMKKQLIECVKSKERQRGMIKNRHFIPKKKQ